MKKRGSTRIALTAVAFLTLLLLIDTALAQVYSQEGREIAQRRLEDEYTGYFIQERVIRGEAQRILCPECLEAEDLPYGITKLGTPSNVRAQRIVSPIFAYRYGYNPVTGQPMLGSPWEPEQPIVFAVREEDRVGRRVGLPEEYAAGIEERYLEERELLKALAQRTKSRRQMFKARYGASATRYPIYVPQSLDETSPLLQPVALGNDPYNFFRGEMGRRLFLKYYHGEQLSSWGMSRARFLHGLPGDITTDMQGIDLGGYVRSEGISKLRWLGGTAKMPYTISEFAPETEGAQRAESLEYDIPYLRYTTEGFEVGRTLYHGKEAKARERYYRTIASNTGLVAFGGK